MARKKKKNKMSNTLLIVSLICFLIVGGLATQANSIAVQVDERWNQPTVDAAFSVCNDERADALANGADCEPCRLSCPSSVELESNGLYSFVYNDGSIYEGSWSDLSCDEIGVSPGNLLQVKSFCNDRIRVCTRQIGSGTVASTEPVANGDIRKVALTTDLYNCATGQSLGDTTNSYRYELVCDTGYTANGVRISETKSLLGSCEPTDPQAREEAGYTPLAGKFGEINFDDRASISEEVTIRGTVLPQVAGKYYVYGIILDGQSFSVVKGFSAQDICKNNPRAAGVFIDLKEGDTGLFELSIPAPDEPGTYTTYVGMSETCEGSDIDNDKAELRVLADEQLAEEVIQTYLTDNPEAAAQYEEEVSTRLDEILALDTCDATTDLTMDGCPVAQCVEGEVFLLNDDQIAEACTESPETEAIKRTVRSAQNTGFISGLYDTSTTKGKAAVVFTAIAFTALIGAGITRMPKKRR